MAFEWKLDAPALFNERYGQMLAQGIPAADCDAVGSAITSMWADEPGGWSAEWSSVAERYALSGDHLLASQAYGWARFPALANESKRHAFRRQLDEYLLAGPGFGVQFDRLHLDLRYGSDALSLPVHLFGKASLPPEAPVVLISGGLDSWKMDLHSMILSMAMALPARVLAFDIPGTGESPMPLSRRSTEIIDSIVTAARGMTSGPVMQVGVSIGGYFSAYSALAGIVDAAVSFGGPVEAAFEAGEWPPGMAGILGNALGLSEEPSPAAISREMAALSLHDLVTADAGKVPVLAIDGANDMIVPQHDVLLFARRRGSTTHLIPDAGHCAAGRRPEANEVITQWLADRLGELG